LRDAPTAYTLGTVDDTKSITSIRRDFMLALNDRTLRAAALSRFGMPTLCASAILLTAANAHAFQFKFEDPQMKGFLDTSTTLNATWRTQKADARRVSYGNQNFSEGDSGLHPAQDHAGTGPELRLDGSVHPRQLCL
jgi:hypothetical protein